MRLRLLLAGICGLVITASAEARPHLLPRLRGQSCPATSVRNGCGQSVSREPVKQAVQFVGQRVEQTGQRIQAIQLPGGCANGAGKVALPAGHRTGHRPGGAGIRA